MPVVHSSQKMQLLKPPLVIRMSVPTHRRQFAPDRRVTPPWLATQGGVTRLSGPHVMPARVPLQRSALASDFLHSAPKWNRLTLDCARLTIRRRPAAV